MINVFLTCLIIDSLGFAENISHRAVHRLLSLISQSVDCSTDELIRMHSLLITTPIKGFDQTISQSHSQCHSTLSFLSFACDSLIELNQSSCWPLITQSVNQPVASSLAALAVINQSNNQSVSQPVLLSSALKALNLDPWQDWIRDQSTSQQSTWQHVTSLIETPSIQDAIKRLEETARLQMTV